MRKTSVIVSACSDSMRYRGISTYLEATLPSGQEGQVHFFKSIFSKEDLRLLETFLEEDSFAWVSKEDKRHLQPSCGTSRKYFKAGKWSAIGHCWLVRTKLIGQNLWEIFRNPATKISLNVCLILASKQPLFWPASDLIFNILQRAFGNQFLDHFTYSLVSEEWQNFTRIPMMLFPSCSPSGWRKNPKVDLR